ncbi:Rha family transcriptional regulator [Bacillus sp. FJAT-52991]|uniref:Rha family transcriptional regulator n=1 Tax=Bacillus kandeliae TaxID=3129297 RepID=A0ABZ2NC40_9BACI
MNSLEIINRNGQLLVDSRQVAEMVDKNHADLLRDIRKYVGILGKSNFAFADFFFESFYTDSQGKPRPHFFLTKKGCDMVANKLTGEKGILFTAAYVSRFEEMEKELIQPDIQNLSPELQMFKHLFDSMAQKQLEDARRDEEIKSLTDNVTTIKETFLKRDEGWRESINRMMQKAGYHSGGNYRDLRNRSYAILEERAHCNLNIRLNNLKARLITAGTTQTKINSTTKMDVIESDVRLKEIYTTIVKELSIGVLKAK